MFLVVVIMTKHLRREKEEQVAKVTNLKVEHGELNDVPITMTRSLQEAARCKNLISVIPCCGSGVRVIRLC